MRDCLECNEQPATLTLTTTEKKPDGTEVKRAFEVCEECAPIAAASIPRGYDVAITAHAAAFEKHEETDNA